jgi:predicted DNA-binding transcriptional regulator YafY
MSKISNVLTMLQLLQSGRKYSINELAKELEVSERMIRVYKEDLEKAGIYIDTIMGPYGGYVLNQDVKIHEKFIKPENIKLDNREYYNLLSKCINSHNKCYIEYYSKEHDKMTKRVIRPYNLMILDNEWGVAAYCENKQEIRHFYLNRITIIKELDEKF